LHHPTAVALARARDEHEKRREDPGPAEERRGQHRWRDGRDDDGQDADAGVGAEHRKARSYAATKPFPL